MIFDTLKDIVLVYGRILTILPVVLAVAIFMGRRAIGELPIFDFLIIITLGAVVGADIADPSIHHIPTAAAVVAIGVLQRLVAHWKITSRTVERLITFEPTIVVYDGVLLKHNLQHIDYSIDNILQMLREKDVFDIRDVRLAIVEANGALSVLKKTEKNPVTTGDMGIQKQSAVAYPVIIDGEVHEPVLKHLHVDYLWLRQQLIQHGIEDVSQVFFASINPSLKLHISLKNNSTTPVPPLVH
ncbi:Uncharacterized membrane protein YcaP, DUF421 family [Alteribacillus persepolensis]|uniref:Uncharacterized membrane protein YcaP, DUF421 family n=1 Tax=Alteribacillus persepolensis TaxID=568899 RepID=A0A1G7Z3S4_9BACI|nr:DUF421 domain-containing protein [Alteribacillus persepolensis]SDH03245.1 Uncharacterized membrane protein YcaP, DUF421 family [Alteribacillus persepolensis]